jgi:hypothetical protein
MKAALMPRSIRRICSSLLDDPLIHNARGFMFQLQSFIGPKAWHWALPGMAVAARLPSAGLPCQFYVENPMHATGILGKCVLVS